MRLYDCFPEPPDGIASPNYLSVRAMNAIWNRLRAHLPDDHPDRQRRISVQEVAALSREDWLRCENIGRVTASEIAAWVGQYNGKQPASARSPEPPVPAPWAPGSHEYWALKLVLDVQKETNRQLSAIVGAITTSGARMIQELEQTNDLLRHMINDARKRWDTRNR